MLFLQVTQNYLRKVPNILILDDPFVLIHNPKVICKDNKNHKCIKTYKDAKNCNLTILNVLRTMSEYQTFNHNIDGCTPNHFNRHYEHLPMF